MSQNIHRFIDAVKIAVKVLGEKVGWSESLLPAGSKLRRSLLSE